MAKGMNISVKPRHRNDTAERMIRRFTKKVKKSGILDDVRNRRHYEKPSVKRRRKKIAHKRACERALKKEKAKNKTNYKRRK